MEIPQASKVGVFGPYAICLRYVLSLDMNLNILKVDERTFLTCIINFMEKPLERLDMPFEKRCKPEQDVLFEWEEKLFCTCLNHNYAEAILKCDI